MNDRIRWGVLGTGAMAAEFVRGLALAPGAVVAAVAARDPARAKAFAARHGIARAHDGYDALLADPAVDVVYVATVHSTHADLCLRALAAGKPVVCEKPFALDAREARAIVAKARERGLFCMEGMWTRFLPALQRARELVAAGAIGTPRAFAARLGWSHVPDPGSRLFDPQLGGGALLDLGVYTVSLACFFLGPVAGVAGSASLAATGVDDSVAIALTHRDGGISSLAATLVADTPNDAVVMGSRGRLELPAPLLRSEALTLRPAAPLAAGRAHAPSPLRDHALARAAARLLRPLLDRLRGRAGRSFVLPCLGNGYAHEAIEVMRCLRAGLRESPVMPLDESVAILDTMDRLRAQWLARPGDA